MSTAPQAFVSSTDFSHVHAAILSTGDEVVLGQIADSNARWIAQKLMDRGVVPVQHAAVPDELDVIVESIERLSRSADLLVMTGGLGPTDGDLTRHALAKVLKDELVVDERALGDLRALMARRDREMSDRQARQAQRPSSAACLPNAVGTAPGLFARIQRPDGRVCEVVCLPGPPGELRDMWAKQVENRLKPRAGFIVKTRLLHVVAMPEAEVSGLLKDLTARDRVDGKALVGMTASGGVITVRIRVEGELSESQARAALDAADTGVRAKLGRHVVCEGDGRGIDLVARAMIEKLTRLGQSFSCVESCTGGGLGALLTSIPGSSKAFAGGLITYSNELKTRLAGVGAELIRRHGSVSEEVARAMALGGQKSLQITHCAAITGIAGPEGGSEEKPVGTVYVALASRLEGQERVDVRRLLITGDREDIRQRAGVAVLSLLHFATEGFEPGSPKLIWQVAAQTE